ncbi:MAG: hypothetical protein WD875_01380 [Pirellulales bacterium]
MPSILEFSVHVAVFVLSIVMLLRGRGRVALTTLAAAWAWALAAVVAVGGVEIAIWLAMPRAGHFLATIPHWATAARYAAAVLALCPTVALLGAKRPQDRAWQWVVLSFWAIMLVPAARAFLLLGGAMAKPHAAQGVFLLVVTLMGIVNWIATRFTWAAIAAGSAQFVLVVPYTPLGDMSPVIASLSPLTPTLIALVVCRLLEKPPRPSDPSQRDWLDFRDAFGLFWAARVMARLNVAARAHGWGLVVTWRGVQYSSADGRSREAFARSLRMLLRRFVSDDWLGERKQPS